MTIFTMKSGVILFALYAWGLSACATTPTTHGFDEARIPPTTDFSAYSTVYIAPVKISGDLMRRTQIKYRAPDRTTQQDRPLDERDLARKAGELKEKLTREIGKVKTLVNSDVKGALIVETTLKDLDANSPTRADYAASPGLGFQSQYKGGASASFKLTANGKVIAKFSDTYRGNIDDIRGNRIWGDADYRLQSLGAQPWHRASRQLTSIHIAPSKLPKKQRLSDCLKCEPRPDDISNDAPEAP